MALVNTFEKQGIILFKYRGQFPIVLFFLSIQFIWFTDYSSIIHVKYYLIISIVLVLLGFMIRFYTIGTTLKGTSGRNRKKQVAESLNSTGIYSIVRHPLYLGNYCIWIGIAFYVFNIMFVIIISFLFWLFYERIMFAEERFLERRFGKEYLDWSNKIPAFFPALSKYKASSVPFSIKSILRREYSGVLATVFSFAFVDFLRNYRLGKELLTEEMLYILVFILIVSLTLKILKRYTKVLFEKDRS